MKRRPHGGARPGAGRPRKPPEERAQGRSLCMWLRADELESVERAASPERPAAWAKEIVLRAARGEKS